MRMRGKNCNVKRWLMDYLLAGKTYQDLQRETPFALVGLTPWIGYSGLAINERLDTIDAWLDSNVRRESCVYIAANSASNDILIYDNKLVKYGAIVGVMFQRDSDAVLFKLSVPELITVTR